jgi:hypothetical protein
MSTKRSRAITIAAAGTLTLATAISAAAATLPSSSSPASASADAHTTTISRQADAQTARPAVGSGLKQAVVFDHTRALQGERQHQQQVAAAKAAAAKAAAHTAAEQAAAGRQAAQQAQPAQQAAVIVPSGSPEQIAEQMLGQYGWSSDQFSCLQPLWEHESGWKVTAENPTSGAYGIPQALPASQMSSAGADWQTNAATQIRWGLTYIQDRYGSPCGAWSHEQVTGWY